MFSTHSFDEMGIFNLFRVCDKSGACDVTTIVVEIHKFNDGAGVGSAKKPDIV